ncbi:polycomb group Pc-like [Olea europaea subsp. europaea]|uniref:Polycomb group Pc-like n=1 Tax=Olea europaea subsp. europaea TaxID=158383 RepID=A0A8S0PG70_OLEEU|nr:polycomb group Pc-like [Olea europaea subsp. europaea]
MAQNQKNKNSKGVCEKIYNAVSGGRKIRLISHQDQGTLSRETAPKSRVQNTDNPKKDSPPKKPVFLNQPSPTMIPIESESSIRPSTMKQNENMQTTAKSAGKDDDTKRVSEISVQEIVISGECRGVKGKMEGKTHGQVEKVPSMKDKLPIRASMKGKTKLKEKMASIVKTKSTKDKATQEKGDEDEKIESRKTNDKFSDYINHVKNKMRTVLSVGGGRGGGDGGAQVGRTATRRDSFKDKVSSFITRAKMKIRRTTTFDGNEHLI